MLARGGRKSRGGGINSRLSKMKSTNERASGGMKRKEDPGGKLGGKSLHGAHVRNARSRGSGR